MSDGISIFDVIKRGGFEASLITTFNANLPFYEEVVLRKLVAAGCRHNVVLMDKRQCALSWESEASRPRLAGYAYTLLPIGVNGAFHPKVCILVGPKKASVLIGSHNLTLSGFGYNREITNWIDIAGLKDHQGTAILKDIWQMIISWINLEKNKLPESVMESALAIYNFINPLIINTNKGDEIFALGQTPGEVSLLTQLEQKVGANVKRIGIIGAFFDHNQSFIYELSKRWPEAELVVGIDPETVHISSIPDISIAKYVDVKPLWESQRGYLHAKALFFDTGLSSTSAFVSGSANPSRPAWMGTTDSGNIEAVLLRFGDDALNVVEAMGIDGIFRLPALEGESFEVITQRTKFLNEREQPASIPVWNGIANQDVGEIQIIPSVTSYTIDQVSLLDQNMELLELIEDIQIHGDKIVIHPNTDLTLIRSCLISSNGNCCVRVIISHPEILSKYSRSSKQSQIRLALGSLGSSEGDISKVIAAVERVIFSEETTHEVDVAVREHKKQKGEINSSSGPDSLSISVDDLPKNKKKLRLLKSGDLAYLIDVLMRSLTEGLQNQSMETDRNGRTEEEQVGQEDMGEERPSQTTLTDQEIANAVARRVRTMTRRMVEQLKLATTNDSLQTSAVIKLVAVLALLRELRRLDKTKRWRQTGCSLAAEKDRRYLLDESLKFLLGSKTHLLDLAESVVGEESEEITELRVLLLWLAWDLGDELAEQIDRTWDKTTYLAKLCGNATFLKLMPRVALDKAAQSKLEESITKTVSPTPAAKLRATKWLERHFEFGRQWSGGMQETELIKIGSYCHVPGVIDDPRVVVELSGTSIGFWDYDQIRRFSLDRAKGVTPVLAG